MSKKTNSASPSATLQDFPIIGVGASAGGLEAFKQFLQAIPDDSGMAYVLVQHLDPTHESILTEILTKSTNIPVLEITDDIHLAPNNIYVIPENKILTSTDGILSLAPREKLQKNPAIDVFFTSLAEVHLSLAAGIILSGTGSDGTNGLKAIQEHGGVTFAQEPETAAYAEMPQSAINAQFVDFILPIAEIPAKLLEIFNEKKEDKNPEDDEGLYQEILSLLNDYSGVDFTYYKQTTIHRRIARRMAISKMENLTDYLGLLRDDKSAPDVLFNDLLIPVTSFFRDPKIFSEIRKTVFPALLKRKTETNSIRIWTAGCSTGEETYSLAIALHEFLGANVNGTQIQIFASDISEISIAKARIGFYTNAQTANLPTSILKKYFTKQISGYQINRQIRDLCVFAVHNFLKDPPFAKMDLISCRNVLIYMGLFLQKKALTTFHYALIEDGFLVLGKSETTAPADDLFGPWAVTGKIFTRNPVSSRLIHQAMRPKEKSKTAMITKTSRPKVLSTDFVKSAETLLLSAYTPANVVINENMDVVHVNGVIAPFLELSPGKPTFNLLKIAREGLVYELRNAFHKAKETNSFSLKEGIPVKYNGSTFNVSIEVRPLTDTVELYYLVLFYNTPAQQTAFAANGLSEKEINDDINLKRIAHLEKELLQTQADVNAVNEEQEALNEDLQSVNEELLSNSEELQSLNEELETSKEELQSSNEELVLNNQELINKQEQINISKNYTEAIVATLREPLVVLDHDLRIKNINRAFSKKFNIAKDAANGKLLYEIQNHLFDNALMRSMLEKILPKKIQIDDYQISVNLEPDEECILLVNACQVANENSREPLILLTIEDITERRIMEQSLQLFSNDLEAKVLTRTAELETSNAELGKSLKDLHKANIKLQQFAYIASHDLQEPLRKILVFTGMLRERNSDLPDEALLLLHKISKSSDRMQTLIQDLLTYSFLNNDDGLLVPTDLTVVLKNILFDFELLIEQKNVAINSSVLPVIDAIPLQMNQLFYNLISNALKFSGTKKPIIDISATVLSHKQLESHPELNNKLIWCEIIIRDNGIGFDQQYEQQIFTIFQRLHSKEAYSGTGIGLSISQKIVENHGGIIFAKSNINEGAAFHVILPVGAPDANNL